MTENIVFQDIKDELIASEILTRNIANEISECSSEKNRISRCIDYLISLDLVKHFDPFLQILYKNKKEHIVRELQITRQKNTGLLQGTWIIILFLFVWSMTIL